MTILEEPEESPSEAKHDAERARLISAFVKEAIASMRRGVAAPLTISVHKLITDDEDDDLYALYFLPDAADPLFMCTIQVKNWEDALEDVRTWLAKTSDVSADQLRPIELDTTYAPRLRSGFVEEP